jgi:hypothetical protein
MTCYFRHLKPVFEKAGITITKENRQDIDRAIRSIVGIEYKNCPATWKEVKKRIAENEESFVNVLKSELTKN